MSEAIQFCDELTPRTPGEKAAYLDGIEEGKMRERRDSPMYNDLHAAAKALADALPKNGRNLDGYYARSELTELRELLANAHWSACPVARGALASSIEEVEALSFSEDRGLTVSDCESMMLVLHELRRLQVIEADAVAIVAREGVIVGEEDFAAWFAHNYPRDTIIQDPLWHAPKIYRAACRLSKGK